MKVKLTLFTAAILFFGCTLFAQSGKITGKVLDGSSGGVLPDAVLKIENLNKGTASDLDGAFSFENVSAGEFSIKATYIGYVSQSVNIKVKAGEVVNVDFILQPEGTLTDTVTIEATRIQNNEAALLLKQQKAENIQDGISSQQIKRTPDALASDVLKRVIGVNIVNDKFVFVRGTSERYNNTTLNGVMLPSTDPDKKSFSFDIFPSMLLDNIIISKSFTADQPGNFSGGLVQLQTKDFPDRFTLNFSTQGGITTETSNEGNFLTYNAGQKKLLFFNSGLDDGSRQLPGAFPNTAFSGQNNYGKLFVNNWEQKKVSAPLNGGFNLSFGGQANLLKNQFGYIFGYSYKNSFSNKVIERNEYNGDTTQIIKTNGQLSEYSVSNGGILNLSYKVGDNNKFSFKNTYSISSEDETEYMEGWRAVVFSAGDEDRKMYRTAFTERKLFSSMFSGSHYIKALRNMNVTWKASYSESNRDEPDMKRAYYRKERFSDDPYIVPITTIANSNVGNRFFSKLFDINRNFSIDAEFDMMKLRKKDPVSKLKIGGFALGTNRNFRARSFDPFLAPQSYVDITAPLEELYGPNNIDSMKINYKEVTSFSDSYNAQENLYAAYLTTDIPVGKFRFVAGLRFEYSEQKMQGFDRTSPVVAIPINVNLKTNDYLPSFNLTYSLSDKTNIRGSVSQTVSRPELRELAPFGFVDFVTDGDFSGNPDLKSSLIQNYDLRFEHYPNAGEILAISFFYKHFNQPIERVIVPTILAPVPSYTFANAENGAVNYGVEIEARKNLGFINKFLKDFSFNVNLTVINSKVNLEGTTSATNELERRMQGQAPFTVNAGLYYDNSDLGTSINLSFNRSGDKISEVGRVGFQNVYEKGRNLFDLSATQRLFKNFEVKFTAKDLMNEDHIFTQNVTLNSSSTELVEKVVKRIKTGINYSISLGYKF
ncbi:MAG: TonB-dependent receptor [Chlorobi bacterium OLB5]|nr:MAG: TonB-dependent receptor [Chlorobi bacterium OLB5]